MTIAEKENHDRPLVTFAVFAYNQEEYIREAIEGAFSQTYEPLEIILSDDCSTDRTFKITQEMAAAYDGPHLVRLRRAARNEGTLRHVISVAKEAKGDLLVVAAGDDISKPERVSRLITAYSSHNIGAIFSDADKVDENGFLLYEEEKYFPKESFQNVIKGCSNAIKYSDGYRNIPGYSAAYNIEYIKCLDYPPVGILNEDSFFSYYLNIIGREIKYIPERLLYYRTRKSINYNKFKEILDNENHFNKFAVSSVIYYPYLFSILKKISPEEAEAIKNKIIPKIKESEMRSIIYKKGFLGRIKIILKCNSKYDIYFVFPRLLGNRVYCFLKIIHEYFLKYK